MSGTPVTVCESAMAWDALQDCVDCAAHALGVLQLSETAAVAEFMKREMDGKYGPRWHVIVGRSFGALVGHDLGHFAHLCLGGVHILVWRVDTTREEREVSAAALMTERAAARAALPDY